MTPLTPRDQRQGMLLILLTALGYSFTPIFMKSVLASGLLPLDIAIWRFVFATPMIWLLIFALRLPPVSQPLPRYRLLAIGGFLVTAALCSLEGLRHLQAGTYAVLFYTYPAMVALLLLLFGERLPLPGWLALALTLMGIALTVPDFSEGLRGGNFLGVALALLNALIVAVYFITSNRVLRGYTGLAQSSAWIMTGAALILVGLALVNGLAMPKDGSVWLSLLGMATISTIVPVFCLTVGLQKLGAAQAAIVGTIEPLLTLAWAAVFLSEVLQPVQLVGGLLILMSVVLLQFRRRAPRIMPNKTSSTAAAD